MAEGTGPPLREDTPLVWSTKLESPNYPDLAWVWIHKATGISIQYNATLYINAFSYLLPPSADACAAFYTMFIYLDHIHVLKLQIK